MSYAYNIVAGFWFLMHIAAKKFIVWFEALRAYSLPISFMSWLVPFIFAVFDNGNIFFGLLALAGIIILHLATNIFDDSIDYLTEKNKIEKGIKKTFDFQPGKCRQIFNKNLTVKDYVKTSVLLFFIAFLIALFFLKIYGLKLLIIVIPASILCLLYPILGCLGFGEVIVAVIFSPLLYLGVYFVMTGVYSLNILLLSVSTGLLSVAVLHNHMLLDFEYDEKNRKITLCRICKTPQNALRLLVVIIFAAYANIAVCVMFNVLNPIFLIVFFSFPVAITLYKVMKIHVNNPTEQIKRTIFMEPANDVDKAPEEQKNFMLKFIIVRNLLSFFTLLICIAAVIEEIL